MIIVWVISTDLLWPRERGEGHVVRRTCGQENMSGEYVVKTGQENVWSRLVRRTCAQDCGQENMCSRLWSGEHVVRTGQENMWSGLWSGEHVVKTVVRKTCGQDCGQENMWPRLVRRTCGQDWSGEHVVKTVVKKAGPSVELLCCRHYGK